MVSPQDKLKNFLFRLENIKKCVKCNNYTFKEICPKCDSKTKTPILLSNRRKILEFIKSRKARGNADNTLLKYLHPLYQMNVLGWIKKPFDKMTKEDIQDVATEVENKDWSPKTRKNFRITLKVFYRWLEGEENFGPNEYPTRVKFIITTIPKRDKKELTFNEILTREDVIKMAQQTVNPMHKALLWVAFESGGRPEEVLNLLKSDIKFDNYGTIVYLKGAKSKRPVRLVSATEPLRDWERKHPLQELNDFDLWVTQFSKKKENGEKWTKLSNFGANNMLKELAKRCNINNKKITLYSLRKGRATELASNPHISRAVLHHYMGWIEGSPISNTYVKLSDAVVEDAILKANGIEPTEKREMESYIECSFCLTKNSPDSLYCIKVECGKPLILGDLQEELKGLIKQLRGERRSLVKELLKDPELEKELMEKFRDWMNSKAIVEQITKTTGY